MSRALDLRNKRFGRLVAIEPTGKTSNGVILWRCQCDCGNEKIARAGNLVNGSTLSCGCLRHEKGSNRKSYRHGLSTHRLNGIWRGIKGRCGSSGNHSYDRYGGRGISVCDEWKNDFMAFYNWAMENGYADNLSIDRIDVNGNYCPENCRWVDKNVQSNNKRNSHYIEVDGKKMTLSEWSKLTGIDRHVIVKRIEKLGYTPEEAISAKRLPRGKRRNKSNDSYEQRAG